MIRQLVLFLLAPVLLRAAETRDLILVAGQSNAVGADALASELPADPADQSVLFWWRTGDPPPDEYDTTSGGKWTTLRPQPRGNPMPKEYQAWKAGLPSEQQAWETVLEQNLGSFYLPLHKKDKIAGRSNAWDFVADDSKLPRVLLIGDSVSRGYTLSVRKALAGKANVHRAPENCGPTANGIKKLDVWLGDRKWDVIHFNFGIHDRATSPADYRQRLDAIVTRLKATGAKLVWASTTPIPPDTKDGPAASAAIVDKNRIAARVMQEHGVFTDDLFVFITPSLATMQNPKDVHFNAEGYDLLGKQVAASIEAMFK